MAPKPPASPAFPARAVAPHVQAAVARAAQAKLLPQGSAAHPSRPSVQPSSPPKPPQADHVRRALGPAQAKLPTPPRLPQAGLPQAKHVRQALAQVQAKPRPPARTTHLRAAPHSIQCLKKFAGSGKDYTKENLEQHLAENKAELRLKALEAAGRGVQESYDFHTHWQTYREAMAQGDYKQAAEALDSSIDIALRMAQPAPAALAAAPAQEQKDRKQAPGPTAPTAGPGGPTATAATAATGLAGLLAGMNQRPTKLLDQRTLKAKLSDYYAKLGLLEGALSADHDVKYRAEVKQISSEVHRYLERKPSETDFQGLIRSLGDLENFLTRPVAKKKAAAAPAKQSPAAPAPTESTAPSVWSAETAKPMYSKIYVYNGRRWTHHFNIEGTTAGHVEQLAYKQLLDNAPSSKTLQLYKASWIGFVQNAPPCPEECKGIFGNLSKNLPGFIFHITGNHGGYCGGYGIEGPSDLYFYKGNLSIGKPAEAKDAPALGPR